LVSSFLRVQFTVHQMKFTVLEDSLCGLLPSNLEGFCWEFSAWVSFAMRRLLSRAVFGTHLKLQKSNLTSLERCSNVYHTSCKVPLINRHPSTRLESDNILFRSDEAMDAPLLDLFRKERRPIMEMWSDTKSFLLRCNCTASGVCKLTSSSASSSSLLFSHFLPLPGSASCFQSNSTFFHCSLSKSKSSSCFHSAIWCDQRWYMQTRWVLVLPWLLEVANSEIARMEWAILLRDNALFTADVVS